MISLAETGSGPRDWTTGAAAAKGDGLFRDTRSRVMTAFGLGPPMGGRSSTKPIMTCKPNEHSVHSRTLVTNPPCSTLRPPRFAESACRVQRPYRLLRWFRYPCEDQFPRIQRFPPLSGLSTFTFTPKHNLLFINMAMHGQPVESVTRPNRTPKRTS